MIFSQPHHHDIRRKTYFSLLPRKCWMTGAPNDFYSTNVLSRHTVWLEQVSELRIYDANSARWKTTVRVPATVQSQLKILRMLDPKIATKIIAHFSRATIIEFAKFRLTDKELPHEQLR